ncbi:MAG: pilus assembly protein PilP [Desulfobacterales bacterium]|nr:MAG: pilus assembly protein PilP [Desulfobacterales bacterium]
MQKVAVAKKDESKPAQPQTAGAQKPGPEKEVVKEMAAAKPQAAPGPAKAEPDVSEKKTGAPVLAEKPTVDTASLTDLYDPQGKLDPFEPLFQAKPIALAAKKKKRKKAPPTPLEKVSLGQLKLVAIIRTENANKALVQEATGKGYIVKKGTYIGLNSGKIIQILKDRIIVEEEVEDVYGKIAVSKKSLQLQKFPGE